jgi:hypothetical protein
MGILSKKDKLSPMAARSLADFHVQDFSHNFWKLHGINTLLHS